MRVHARGGNFDGSSPVEVVVAQIECEFLQLQLGQSGLVHRHEEVRGLHAALSAPDRDEEEVELTCSALRSLNEVAVDDASARWVAQTVAFEDEERLDDPLVHDDERDLRSLSSLVVQLVEGALELRDLSIDDLRSLSPADAITVDEDVSRQVVVVVFGENLHSSLDAVSHLRLDHFLALLLDDEVRVVLTELLVD